MNPETPFADAADTPTQLLPEAFDVAIDHDLRRPVRIAPGSLDACLTLAHPHPTAAAAEYRTAAANLLHGDVRTARIFVTSPIAGDGKTCTALNLAWAMAESGRSVLLAELNFAHPAFRTALGNLQLRFGVDTALRGESLPEDSVFAITPSSLHIAALRQATPLASQNHLLEHLNDFFDWAGENYDMMLVDCPPVISPEWNQWFQSFVGPSLLVVREGHTPLIRVQQAASTLNENLTGILLNATRDRMPSAVLTRPGSPSAANRRASAYADTYAHNS